MSEEVRAENCSDFSHIVQSCGRNVHKFYGIIGGTSNIILIALYFIVKWAVKNGIKEAYTDITGKKPVKDIQDEKELNELLDDTKDR